jgi:hypothetical protein
MSVHDNARDVNPWYPTEEDWAELMAELDANGGWPDAYPDEAPVIDLAATYEPTPEDREWADRHLDPAPEPKPKRARKVKAPKAPKGADIRLAAIIDGVTYAIEGLDPGGCGTEAVRLVKTTDGKTYDVVRDHYGLVLCDCPHYEYRLKGNSAGMCKHGSAGVKLGLIKAPTPIPAHAGSSY